MYPPPSPSSKKCRLYPSDRISTFYIQSFYSSSFVFHSLQNSLLYTILLNLFVFSVIVSSVLMNITVLYFHPYEWNSEIDCVENITHSSKIIYDITKKFCMKLLGINTQLLVWVTFDFRSWKPNGKSQAYFCFSGPTASFTLMVKYDLE